MPAEFRFMALQKQCRMCLNYFQESDWLLKIPMCEHIFHQNCLKKWLVEWQKCPTCESNIIHIPDDQKAKYTNASRQEVVEMVR